MNPVRLYPKQPTNEEKFEMWLMSHANVIVPILLVTLAILVVLVCVATFYVFFGTSATESGLWFNHLKELI